MNQMGNLEKLGILVIVILVVVVGVVAITPKEQVDSALFEPKAGPVEPLDQPGDALPDDSVAPGRPGAGTSARKDWPLGATQADLPADAPASEQQPGATPAPAPALVATVPPAPQPTEYVVVKGDTGVSIVRKTLGKGGTWADIVAVNPTIDARKLQPGQRIVIPAAKGTAANPAPQGATPPSLAPIATVPAPDAGSAKAVEPAAAAERIYSVQSGDTLTDIARRELGSPSKWRQILEANADVLHGSEHVRPGMKLRIPGRTAAAPAPASAGAAVAAAAPARTGTRSYVVQSGDTLTAIASRTLGSGSRWREILRANDGVLHGSEKLVPGMQLSIPEDVSAK